MRTCFVCERKQPGQLTSDRWITGYQVVVCRDCHGITDEVLGQRLQLVLALVNNETNNQEGNSNGNT